MSIPKPMSPERLAEIERMRDRAIGHHRDALTELVAEVRRAREAIASVFQLIENSHLEPMHDTDCPCDDTCRCLVRRILLDLQVAGGINVDAALGILAGLPPRGPHDRVDCPCGHPLGETGPCAGCNCADEEP